MVSLSPLYMLLNIFLFFLWLFSLQEFCCSLVSVSLTAVTHIWKIISFGVSQSCPVNFDRGGIFDSLNHYRQDYGCVYIFFKILQSDVCFSRTGTLLAPLCARLPLFDCFPVVQITGYVGFQRNFIWFVIAIFRFPLFCIPQPRPHPSLTFLHWGDT